MADHSKIEWTDATWNPITGCSLMSEGCRFCYAAELAATRLKNHPSRVGLTKKSAAGVVQFNGKVRFNDDWLDQPLRWRKPRMIFVCAHADLFHENVADDWIDKIFAVMALCPQHTFQVLTKRPERMKKYMQRRNDNAHHPAMDYAALMAVTGCWDTPALDLLAWPLANVWLGVSVEDQVTADTRIPYLLDTPAAVRFLSAEPLLGPVQIPEYMPNPLWNDLPSWKEPEIDWVIAGGESGRNARPMHPQWVRDLRDQCAAAEVPFLFKQWGSWQVVYDRDRDDPDWRECGTIDRKTPNGQWLNLSGGQGFHGESVVRVARTHKKTSGRVLDGVTHDGFPEVRS
ncbi:phage Gp37/Gp68 family protein [uncultured Roseibium sp.]|uniref:DUF5131 family protein n=1 Tax=uncultured Roseibium sp. TaxID=1936171 RepID=UPI002607873F|nr:phage Gp37/Gp68 family protein [uncultured Roseibium sp.]